MFEKMIDQITNEYHENGFKFLKEKYNENGYKVKKILNKYKIEPRKCECGCGEIPRNYNAFVNGHNARGVKGRKQSDDSKAKISRLAKERFKNGQKVNCKIYDIPTKEDLVFLYNEQGYSMNKLSKMMDTSIPTLKKWLKSYDIKVRGISSALKSEHKNERITSPFSDEKFQQEILSNRKEIRVSKTEIEIREWIKTIYNGEVCGSYKSDDHYEIDIYIPEKRIGFEYNGFMFHSENAFHIYKNYKKTLKEIKALHQYKTHLANKRGIHLIHIWEDDWKNKKDVVKRKIKYLLLGPDKRVYARKCKIQEVGSQTAKEFYDRYHIQGGSNKYSVSYGLFTVEDNEMVACVSYTKRKENYELTRYCTSCSVVGGFSKLVKHFLKNHTFSGELYSFADLTIVDRNNNVYLNNGWKEQSYLKPDYKYIVNGKRLHKFGFRHSSLKHKLKFYDPNLTEYENCLNNGIYRIWDAGKIKYVYAG